MTTYPFCVIIPIEVRDKQTEYEVNIMIKTMFNGGINGSWDFMAMFAQDAEKFKRNSQRLGRYCF